MKRFLFFNALISIFGLTACQVSTSSMPTPTPTSSVHTQTFVLNNGPVQGTWASGCVATSAGYFSSSLKFEGANLIVASGLYQTSDCSDVASDLTSLTGNYVLRPDAQGRMDYYALDFTYDGTVNYNLIQIQGDKLFIGDQSSADRPEKVNVDIPFKLVKNIQAPASPVAPAPAPSFSGPGAPSELEGTWVLPCTAYRRGDNPNSGKIVFASGQYTESREIHRDPLCNDAPYSRSKSTGTYKISKDPKNRAGYYNLDVETSDVSGSRVQETDKDLIQLMNGKLYLGSPRIGGNGFLMNDWWRPSDIEIEYPYSKSLDK